MASSDHRWKFIRSGGIDQVVIRSGADIVNLDQLDQKLWVALACPTRGIEFDPRTLDLIDANNDGRIRPPELIAVSHWVRDHFADPDLLMKGGDSVPLSAIRTDTDGGAAMHAHAREVLGVVGKADAEAISLTDLQQRTKVLSDRGFNGDGVVPESAADDPEVAELIGKIIDAVGGVADRNGKLGVDAAHAKQFFEQARALHGWRAKAAADEALRPLGDESRSAAEALIAVREKVDDYFVRCRVAAYDPAAAAPLNPSTDDYRALHQSLLARSTAEIEKMPLATAAPDRPLPLRERLNPAWAARIEALRVKTAEPLLGRSLDELTEDEWIELKRRLGPCSGWLAERPQTKLDSLAPAALDKLIDGTAEQRLTALIARDEAAGPSNKAMIELEKLVRFQRDLVHLLNNFVSFAEFYSRQGAIFEAGLLYLDARSCELAIEVTDPARHAKLAGLAKAYLAYCDCTRDGEKKKIVAAFTNGDIDFLFEGRNGVFYDRAGRDWDATITKVIENPMSIRQAFFSPYKKFVRMIEEQVAKRAAESEKRSQSALGNVASRAAHADQAGKAGAGAAAAAAKDAGPKIDVGTVAALGVALGSISTVIVAVFSRFIELGWWLPAGLFGIMMAISGPSMLIAWLKLRQRSLGPLLDASGWAINGRMRINVPLGASLTQIAELPAGAERRMSDPHQGNDGSRIFWLLVLLLAVAALFAWRFGWFERFTAGG
ncbi:hypothetical protein [Piscinibacter sakaiensis]|uniref:hypothetical protein n=1 Tax=Piscinibacter sakaiensis TaxID=1547922 RepID=UPI003AAF8DB0